MATFTSVTSGNWNDGATWGKTSPGVKGTDWPGLAGDVVNIGTTAGQSHVVTYNVSETNELGQVTIGATSGTGTPRLDFSTSMNTKLTLGHQDILIQATGELRVGASGAVISKPYTADLVWNTTGDNAKGLNLSPGGKLTAYGDPTYYGSKYDYIVAAQVVIPAATNSVTVTIAGNYASNFTVGHELLIHKGGAYASWTNDFARLAVVSAANNGANTDISCAVTERPGASLTCLVGADVLNVNRNVRFTFLNYNTNINAQGTVRPRISNSNVAGTNNINISDAMFGGWYSGVAGP